MTKQPFSSSALDRLVDESISEADELSQDLKSAESSQLAFPELSEEDMDDYLPESDKTFAETKNVIDKNTGSAISYNYIYKKIGDLIDRGNASLEMLQSIDLDVADPALIGQTATLMNAIRGCISEFTKIHQQWIRFNQTMQLEKQRLANRKELIRFRNNVINGVQETQQQQGNLVEVMPAELVEFLAWKKQKEQAEQERKDKI